MNNPVRPQIKQARALALHDTDATASLFIHGNLLDGDFPAWIANRARLLALSGWVKHHNEQLVELHVCGHPVLIEALEAACYLGPMSVDVRSIDTRSTGSSSEPLQPFFVVDG